MEENKPAKIVSHHVIDLPVSTIFKILLALFFVVCLKMLTPLLMTLFLSVLLAVSLYPIVRWLENKGLGKKWSVGFITLVLASCMYALFLIILPQLFKEFANFISHLPELRQQVLESVSTSNPLRSMIERSLDKNAIVPKTTDMAPIMSMGTMALSSMTDVVLVFVLSIYLVMDGPGVITWFTAFFSPLNQKKIEQTRNEVAPIISAYVAGQFITSILSFFYVLIALSALNVPSALMLATLAGIFDVLPVLGFFLAVIPAMIFAASVSGSTALLVLLLYIIYHGIENYFIMPAVYGNRLRVSSFVVLISLIAAGILAGLKGAVAILPIVASFSIIERIWLKRFVGAETIADHASVKSDQ